MYVQRWHLEFLTFQRRDIRDISTAETQSMGIDLYVQRERILMVHVQRRNLDISTKVCQEVNFNKEELGCPT